MLNYLDIFAGAGGLSEGFSRAGFHPIAHIEMEKAACFTLKTRAAYKWLLEKGQEDTYDKYLRNEITRQELYNSVPQKVLDSVLNYTISKENLELIFDKIDERLKKKKKTRKIDLLVGGPPCQAYSLVGRARASNSMVGDERNYLYLLYAEFLKRYRPRYFVFENVKGLLSAKDKDGKLFFNKIKDIFKSCGYSVEYALLNAKNFGVLQNRERIIIIGKLGNHHNFYPNIKPSNSIYTVNDILNDLPFLNAGEGNPYATLTKHYEGKYLYKAGIKKNDCDPVTLHFARPNTDQDLEIYRRVVEKWNINQERLSYLDLPKELRTHNNVTSFLDRFKVVAADLQYSQAIVAHLSKDGHYFIHPDIKQNRSLTPREAARLQTFPDDYYFESVSGDPSRTLAFKQIGNAVPVLLAEKIARALLENW